MSKATKIALSGIPYYLLISRSSDLNIYVYNGLTWNIAGLSSVMLSAWDIQFQGWTHTKKNVNFLTHKSFGNLMPKNYYFLHILISLTLSQKVFLKIPSYLMHFRLQNVLESCDIVAIWSKKLPAIPNSSFKFWLVVINYCMNFTIYFFILNTGILTIGKLLSQLELGWH